MAYKPTIFSQTSIIIPGGSVRLTPMTRDRELAVDIVRLGAIANGVHSKLQLSQQSYIEFGSHTEFDLVSQYVRRQAVLSRLSPEERLLLEIPE